MSMTTAHERDRIDRMIAGMPRSAWQTNAPHESDAELVDLTHLSGTLAVTTDAVVEEIAAGLYDDPYLAGWMTVVANVSDLAAVGARPFGILISESLPPDMKAESVGALQRGITDAARTHAVPVLGGDTNAASALHLSATALGTVPHGGGLTRRGAAVGDLVFVSAPLGLGSAFAAARLLPVDVAVHYQPHARTQEGMLLGAHATSCIDTSDGFIAACDEIMRINAVGMLCTRSLHEALDTSARGVAHSLGLPSWMMLAGPHGDFELLFTIPRDGRTGFLAAARRMEWTPLELGHVTTGGGLQWQDGTHDLTIDSTAVRNLFDEVDGNPEAYMRALMGTVA